MRTTLDIADDVLYAAKEVARRDKKTLGQIASELMRRGLNSHGPGLDGVQPDVMPSTGDLDVRMQALGFRTLPARGGIVTNELINRLREQEGI